MAHLLGRVPGPAAANPGLEGGQPMWFGSVDLGKSIGLSQPRMANIVKELAAAGVVFARRIRALDGGESRSCPRSGVYQVIAQLQDKELGRRVAAHGWLTYWAPTPSCRNRLPSAWVAGHALARRRSSWRSGEWGARPSRSFCLLKLVFSSQNERMGFQRRNTSIYKGLVGLPE